MKTLRFIIASLAMVAMLASCGEKEAQPQPGPGTEDKSADPSDKSTDPEAPKSDLCKLESITITAGPYKLEPFIDNVDKSVEISYMPAELEYLAAAKVEATISEKATITPDLSQPIDFTVKDGVTLTVTAEDGEHKTEYHVYLAAAEFTQKVERVNEWTLGSLGLKSNTRFDSSVGFVDRSHFAFSDLSVFDLDGNKVGTLNIQGIPPMDATNGHLASMSNDENGILVAISHYNGVNEEGEECVCSGVYAWLDGWDKAPTLIDGPRLYNCSYMSAAGDVKGDFILNYRTGANNPQMHHVFVFKNGEFFKSNGESAATWYGPMIQHPGNDGCWGQQLSFFSSNPEDGFVCWDSVGATEMGETTGNSSSGYYVYGGLSDFLAGNDEEIVLRGTINWPEYEQDPRWFGYGNHSCGHVRAFKYNGVKCIVASHISWPNSWITIQKAEDIVLDDEETDEVDESVVNYLLRTDKIEETGSSAVPAVPSSAYVLDPESGTGHIVYSVLNFRIVTFDLITTRL